MALLSVQMYFIIKSAVVREKVMNDGIKEMNGKMLSKIYSSKNGIRKERCAY